MLLKILLLLLGAILTITIYACIVAGKRADEREDEENDLQSRKR